MPTTNEVIRCSTSNHLIKVTDDFLTMPAAHIAFRDLVPGIDVMNNSAAAADNISSADYKVIVPKASTDNDVITIVNNDGNVKVSKDGCNNIGPSSVDGIECSAATICVIQVSAVTDETQVPDVTTAAITSFSQRSANSKLTFCREKI